MATTPTLWKPLTQVNATDAGNQYDTKIVALRDGGYLVAWTDTSRVHNPEGDAIVGRKYNAQGQQVGGEVKLSVFASGAQLMPQITTLSNGNIAVAYTDVFGGDYDIYVRIFDTNLNPLRDDLVDTSSSHTAFPAITALAGNSYMVSYTFGPGGSSDIAGRIVSPTGVVGARFEIANDGRDMRNSEVATLSNGNIVVVYEDYWASIDDDVSLRIMTPSGATVLGPTWVAGTGSSAHETAPDVAALKGGGFVVVWGDESSEALYDYGVRATIYNNAGTVVRGNFAVNTTTPGNQIMSSVTSLDDGGFLVTWKDEGLPLDQLVRSQRFDAAGNKVGAEFTVMDPGSIAYTPEAAQLADGRIAYAIADSPVPDADYDLMTTIWDPYGPRSDDFNKDARSDILWRHDGGTIAQWFMDGGLAPVTAAPARPPLEDVWQIEGIGDFNGDARNDILFRHADGYLGSWHMDGATVLSTHVFGEGTPNAWHVQGVADFNGDGKSDLLWRHDDGTVGTWHMDGATVVSTHTFAGAPPPWHIQGTGDFNGDGRDDILLRHDDGTIGIWHMNGAAVLSMPTLRAASAGWHIEDTGDFNGDRKDDILFRHDDGRVGTWHMNGGTILSSQNLPGSAAGWEIEGTGDFNGDGKDDILFRRDDGTVATWHVNGGTVTSTHTFTLASTEWHIEGHQYEFI